MGSIDINENGEVIAYGTEIGHSYDWMIYDRGLRSDPLIEGSSWGEIGNKITFIKPEAVEGFY